jgi:hypothetical protein
MKDVVECDFVTVPRVSIGAEEDITRVTLSSGSKPPKKGGIYRHFGGICTHGALDLTAFSSNRHSHRLIGG